MGLGKKIRAYQDRAINCGWRIQHINHFPTGPGGILVYKTKWVAVFCLLAAITFGVIYYFTRQEPYLVAGVCFFLGTIGSAFIEHWLERRGWVQVQAKCLDRELRLVMNERGRTVWTWRWLCEFEFKGQTYQATPGYWLSWGKQHQHRAEAFGERVVSPSGEILIKVNPKNPLQCEVLGNAVDDEL